MTPVALVVAAAALLVGWTVGVLWTRSRVRRRQDEERAAGRDEASRLMARAREDAEALRRSAELEGREEALRLREAGEREEARRRDELERDEVRRREELERAERRLQERTDGIDRTLEELKRRDQAQNATAEALDRREAEIGARMDAAEQGAAEVRSRLESLAGLSAEEARRRLIEELQDEARAEGANRLREIREEAQRNAQREARLIIAGAIQRMAGEQTTELTVSVVQLPSDEMKGRIIGREGRNIRAFEQATGIDVIIDDTPEAVILSGFDPVRREVARIALEKLIEDGRIHPGRIEELVERSRADVDRGMIEAAEAVLYELGIHNVHPEIVKVLGRLRFRTSYGQNQLAHSREVALLAGLMAAELGLDVAATRRAALLHDVGKGLTHEHEGTHVELGWNLCRRHGEGEIVLNSIRAHHDEEPHRFPEAFLVTAADAISGARPGARREMFESYVRRLEKLEEIAMSYPGVERCFAIQAGREVRVMVQPDRVSDQQMAQLSEEVARRFESELQYPGQIKVVVVRETRAVDFAR